MRSGHMHACMQEPACAVATCKQAGIESGNLATRAHTCVDLHITLHPNPKPYTNPIPYTLNLNHISGFSHTSHNGQADHQEVVVRTCSELTSAPAHQRTRMAASLGGLQLFLRHYVPFLFLMTTWGGGVRAWKGPLTADASSNGEFMTHSPSPGVFLCTPACVRVVKWAPLVRALVTPLRPLADSD